MTQEGNHKWHACDVRSFTVLSPRRLWSLRALVAKDGKHEVAKRAGVSSEAIYRVLRGQTIALDTAKKISRIVD